jgi:hypothetical protein
MEPPRSVDARPARLAESIPNLSVSLWVVGQLAFGVCFALCGLGIARDGALFG